MLHHLALLIAVIALPVLRDSASTAPPAPSTFDLWQLLGTFIPIIAAAVSVPLFDWIKQTAIPWFDTLPAILQQLLVAVLVTLITWLTSLTGAVFPTTVAGLNPTAIASAIGTILAYALKNAQHVSAIKSSVVAKPPPH